MTVAESASSTSLPEAEKSEPAKRLTVVPRHPLAAGTAITIVVLSILCGLATFVVLTGLSPIKPSRQLITWLLVTNLVLVGLMAAMIGLQLWKLLSARRQGTAGAGLHVRMVGLFGLVAALPAIIVAVFATVTLNRGLDTWFAERTRSIVNSSAAVAQSYVRETSERIRGDVISIANDLNQQRRLFDQERPTFIRRVATHVALRGLSALYVIDRARKFLDVSITANNRIKFKAPNEEAFAKADKGEMVLLAPGEDPYIRALIKLTSFDSRYLYISRNVDADVLRQLEKARESKVEFDQLLNQRQGVQVTFGLMYAGVALVFLLSAVWTGLWFADRLVEPIINLVDAARRVALGDFGEKVPAKDGPSDLQTLSRTFNQMTDQLETQRSDLMSANQQLDDRRRFTEAMLAGVSAGVIGIDPSGRVDLVNRSAAQLLGRHAEDFLGRPLRIAVPPLTELFDQARGKPSGSAEGQVAIVVEGQQRNFTVRVTTEKSGEEDHGYVVTFDDITELMTAQRNSAWADIARRIAHEIKNPLTPIQLSAERLKRKYSKEIRSDPQVFEQCTSTIIRQVEDIGRMVDEFSAFARMPTAVLEHQDLIATIKEATILQRVSSSDVEIDMRLPGEPLILPFDRRLATQAVTNLVKNAREAIEARQKENVDPAGKIVIEIENTTEEVAIVVTDNGMGLPTENRHRLTEPYVTTREKGTGLGLAIVKRIMEEHGGRLVMQDAPQGGGAQIRLVFHRAPAEMGKRSSANA